MPDRSFSLSNYPLCWPDHWTRTPDSKRKNGQFKHYSARITVIKAIERILEQMELMHIRRDDVLISTNIPTRLDGLPRSDQREPADPGVAVYWRKSQNAAMSCMAVDIYKLTADNLAAVAATLEALRAIERHGGAQVQERTFRGFAALPGTTGEKHWSEVLGLTRDADIQQIEARYKLLARSANQDFGQGAELVLLNLNVARDAARSEKGAN